MGIVSVDIEKLLDSALDQPKNVLDWDDSFNSVLTLNQTKAKISDVFKPVFGNMLSYASAVAIHENADELKNVMNHAFRFYEDRLFMILSFNDYDERILIFEVDTDRNNYKNLKPYQFNYLKLGVKHKRTGILERNGYSLGYHYNSFEGDIGITSYIVYTLFKDNVLYAKGVYNYVYNGVHNSDSRLNDLSNLPSSFNKKEWKEIFKSIFVLYTIK